MTHSTEPHRPPGVDGNPRGSRRRPRTSAGSRRDRSWSRYLRTAPRLIAALTRLAGILAVLDGALPADERQQAHRLAIHLLPIPASDAATAIAVALGLLLLRVAAGLRRRKRRAWRIAVTATALIGLGYLVRGHRGETGAWGALIVMAVLLALLVSARSEFTAHADPVSRWFAVRILLQFLAAGLAYGLVVLYLNPENIVGRPGFGARVHEVLASMVGLTGPLHLQGERFRDLFSGTLLAIGLLTAAIVVTLTLRASEPIARLSAADEQQLRQLLRTHGARDSLGYFALRRDKSVIWSPTGKAAIAYRVVHGVMLASGDPIGDPEAWPGVITSYRELAHQYGWVPAVIGCSELGATVFKRDGDLRALAMGDEAIVDVDAFSLDGRAMRGVRQACTRISRAGYVAEARRVRELSTDELDELAAAAERWRGDELERGFSMALSRLGDPHDGDCVLVTARLDGQLRALLHLVPWGDEGLSLDLMRREHGADNGINEFLIAKLIEAAPEFGVRAVSLNFAMFREAIELGERIGAGPFLRAWRQLLMIASRWWQIESLYRFNVKFRPAWQPRYLSYPSSRDLPRIAIAALEAEAFLVRPRMLKRLVRRPTP
jgi:lysyl-tRNA synthetase class 2